ncbi:MAG TPA: hypothetical protein VFO29_08650 [Candidatus Rubrimentiphilum sp.]|nr:hypothetical protein [Candidatus Rubrimentiphilum sp.]
MMEDVTQKAGRIVALSALLGLPAAVLAHAGIFGRAHVLGGGSHALFWALWIAFAGAAVASALIPAFLNARFKSTLAPPLAALLTSTASWFAVIELREQPHAIPVLPAMIALGLAAWIVGVAWRGLARAAAEIALELVQILRAASEPRAFAGIGIAVPTIAAHAHAHRLFSRPPPV